MSIFNDFVSALVGALLVTLSTLGATSPPTVDPSVPPTEQTTSAEVQTKEVTALNELYANLLAIQERFAARSRVVAQADSHTERERETEHNTQAGSTEESTDPETHRSGAETSSEHAVRERTGDDNGIHQNRDREDDEDDDDDEGDDDHSRRGSGSSGTTSGSTGTGANTNTGTGTNTSTTTTFTLAQVAQHNTSASCYTVVSGSVYDVTSWISQHPGGASAIKNMCGIDASAAFNGQHGGQARPASELAGFKIGTLAQ